MNVIEIGKKVYVLPWAWNELSKQQLLRVIKVLNSDVDIETGRKQLFKILSGASWFRLLLYPLDVMENIHYTEFLFEPEYHQYLTKNLIPSFRGFYGPKSNLDNSTTVEFFWAKHHYMQWVSNHSDNDLDICIGILYRSTKRFYDFEKDPEGDGRKPFNEHLLHYYADKVKHWPIDVKRAIAKFFEHCVLTIKNMYPDAFNATGSGEPSKFGFYSLIRGVADRGTHGDFKEVEKMNIHTFFIELSEIIIADKKLTK